MPSFIFKLKSMQFNDKHTPEEDNASLSSTFSVGELKKRNAPLRGILVDVSRSSGKVRKSVRFNDEPNVCSEAAVSKRYASICWYSKDEYHDFKDEYFHSIRRLVSSPKACDCNFRRLVSSIHTSCCSKTNGVCSTDEQDLSKCYSAKALSSVSSRTSLIGLERMSSKTMFHEAKVRRSKMLDFLRNGAQGNDDQHALAAKLAVISAPSALFAQSVGKAIHLSQL